MKPEDIRNILMIGAGNMGQQIGFLCAMNGFNVIMYDVGKEELKRAENRMTKLAAQFVASSHLTREKADTALRRIQYIPDAAEAAHEADLVSESVPEDPALKGRVFAQFNKLCPYRTVFTTNTSTLIPSMFAEATGRPDRFAAFHFHDVRVTNVVDIMPHPGTSPETTALIQGFAERIGQIAIVLKKENFGYVFNAMLMDLFKAAQTLAANQVAAVEDIDRSWMGVMHTLIGPFGIMDSIGLDTVWKVTDYWANQLKTQQALTNAAFLKQYVERGDLGVKSGRGFYTYPNPAFAKADFVQGKIK